MKNKYNYLTISLFGIGTILISTGIFYLIKNRFHLTTDKFFLIISLLGMITTLILSRKVHNKYLAYTLSTTCSFLLYASIYYLNQAYALMLTNTIITVFWTLGLLTLSYIIPNLPILYQIILTTPKILFYEFFRLNKSIEIIQTHFLYLIMFFVLTICAFSIIYLSPKYKYTKV